MHRAVSGLRLSGTGRLTGELYFLSVQIPGDKSNYRIYQNHINQNGALDCVCILLILSSR